MSLASHWSLSSLSLHDTRRLSLVCHLLLCDGVARRMEEWCGKTPPLLFQGWAGQVSPMELRRQIGNVIAQTLPRDINERLFHMVYDYPLFQTDPNTSIPHLQLPDISFLASEVPPPLEVILSQTGFPHTIIAAWFLATHYPLLDERQQLHPVWAAFYMRQLLEWELRRIWTIEVYPQIEQFQYPWNVLDIRFPFPECAGYAPHHILEFCYRQDTSMDLLTPPEEPHLPQYLSLYMLHWFRRSMHPRSFYQQLLLHPSFGARPPHVSDRFQKSPHVEQRFQLFIEQRAVLMYFAALRPLFPMVSSRKMLRHLLSPFMAAAWLDIHGVSLPDPETIFPSLAKPKE